MNLTEWLKMQRSGICKKCEYWKEMVTLCTGMSAFVIFMNGVVKPWTQHWSVHLCSLEDL